MYRWGAADNGRSRTEPGHWLRPDAQGDQKRIPKMKNTASDLASIPALAIARRLAAAAGSTATTPRGIIRAALASRRECKEAYAKQIPTRFRKFAAGVPMYSYERPLPKRRATLTADQRDDRRAKADPAFAKSLKKIRAAKAAEKAKVAAKLTRNRALVMTIASRYHHTVKRLFSSQYADILHKHGITENVEWDRYSKKYKYPCKYSDAGAAMHPDGSIGIYPVKGDTITLPALPAKLAAAADLKAALPVGLLGVPVTGQPGVIACMGVEDYKVTLTGKKHPLHRGLWIFPAANNFASNRRKVTFTRQRWVAVGFAVAGHQVPACVATGTITLADIAAERSIEAQRIMIERMGYDKYLAESGAVAEQEDEFGRLYSVPGGLKIARLLNSTANEDGTVNEYFLPVPRSMKTAHEAVAWSFGCTTETYRPMIQS